MILNIKKPIYLLGRIIHNDIVVEGLKKIKGVIVLDDKKTKLSLWSLKK
ncbi:MAG: hypothetical protein L6U99_13705 [Clostridium sp.]|nr:MAG: hypothetical protein L6U99_13705 [Clostridium sp.]